MAGVRMRSLLLRVARGCSRRILGMAARRLSRPMLSFLIRAQMLSLRVVGRRLREVVALDLLMPVARVALAPSRGMVAQNQKAAAGVLLLRAGTQVRALLLLQPHLPLLGPPRLLLALTTRPPLNALPAPPKSRSLLPPLKPPLPPSKHLPFLLWHHLTRPESGVVSPYRTHLLHQAQLLHRIPLLLHRILPLHHILLL